MPRSRSQRIWFLMIAHFLIWHGTFSLGPRSSGGWGKLVHWSCFYKDPEFLKLSPVWPDCLSNAPALNPSSLCRLGFQICGLEGGKQRHWDHGLEPEPLWIFFIRSRVCEDRDTYDEEQWAETLTFTMLKARGDQQTTHYQSGRDWCSPTGLEGGGDADTLILF